MKAAVIQNNTVTNIIIAEHAVFGELEAAINAALVCVDDTECGICWTTTDGGAHFSPPDEEEEGSL